MSEPVSGSFAALKVRDFRILWVGTIFSFLAFFMSIIVQGVVAFEIAGNNSAVGIIIFAQGAAMLLLGPIGGAFADRWSKRSVVVITQFLAGCVFLGTSILIAMGAISIAWLAASSLLTGIAIAFLGPARQGMVVEVVPAAIRGNAMAVNNLGNTGSRVFGPVVAGALLAWESSGALGAYLAMACFYFISAAAMGLIRSPSTGSEVSGGHVLSDVIDGLTYVYRERRLRLLMAFFVLVTLLGVPHMTILPGLSENVLGRGAAGVSELFFVSAVGALAAGLWVTRFGDSPHAERIYISMALLFALGLFGLALAPSFFWAEVAIFFVGAGSGAFQSLNGAVVARATDAAYIGRVMSLVMLAFGGFGLMALPYGYWADQVGERAILLIMGWAVLFVSIVFGVVLVRVGAVWKKPGA